MFAHTRIMLKCHTKKGIYLDMYAIFDVFLLLLSWFILFIDFSPPVRKLDLWVPPIDKKGWEDPLFYGHITRNTPKKERILNIVIQAHDEISFYVGLSKERIITIKANRLEIRRIITAHLNKASPICRGNNEIDCWDPIFIIRPEGNSRYENFIWVLDELAVSGARKYIVAMN